MNNNLKNNINSASFGRFYISRKTKSVKVGNIGQPGHTSNRIQRKKHNQNGEIWGLWLRLSVFVVNFSSIS